jgi:predicted transcriptional regulator
MENETVITLTADIVSAHLSHNKVAPADLPRLIESVFEAMINLGAVAPVVEEKREPAVSVRSSVKPEAITCLDCGGKFKMLKRHLRTDHDLTPADYRARWNLNADYPLVAPDYAAKRRDLAVKIGLGRKSEPAPAKAPEARKPGRPKKVVAAA